MTESTARDAVIQYAWRDRFDVTAWIVEPGDIRVFDWTCHRLRASGASWAEVAHKLGLS